MTRRAASAVLVLAALLLLGVPPAAWAAPTTEVIQGRVLRLVSVADWEAARGLLPGQPVRWDVTVSARAPHPGAVRIGISATGDAPLRLDIALCARPWQGDHCPSGATPLRTQWRIPRDGGEVALTEIADTDTAHLRLTIALEPRDGAGSTQVRLLAHGAGETATVGPDGGLAATGSSPWPPTVLGGVVLLAAGVFAVRRRRREPPPPEGAS